MRARESVAERALRRLIAATNKASQVRDAIAERTRIAAWEFGAKFGPLAIGDEFSYGGSQWCVICAYAYPAGTPTKAPVVVWMVRATRLTKRGPGKVRAVFCVDRVDDDHVRITEYGDDDPSGPWYVAERMNRMKEKEDGANG